MPGGLRDCDLRWVPTELLLTERLGAPHFVDLRLVGHFGFECGLAEGIIGTNLVHLWNPMESHGGSAGGRNPWD